MLFDTRNSRLGESVLEVVPHCFMGQEAGQIERVLFIATSSKICPINALFQEKATIW